MIELTQEDINNLPLHDSDFLGCKLSQEENGQTELILSIAFCESEFEGLDQINDQQIESNKYAALVFRNCWWININIVCNRTQKDAVDYARILTSSQKLNEFGKKSGLKHIEIIFISGSKLECVAESSFLQFEGETT